MAGGGGGWRGWNNVYFTENKKICMRDEDMEDGSHGPEFRRKRNAETESRAGLQQRHHDPEPASGGGERLSCEGEENRCWREGGEQEEQQAKLGGGA